LNKLGLDSDSDADSDSVCAQIPMQNGWSYCCRRGVAVHIAQLAIATATVAAAAAATAAYCVLQANLQCFSGFLGQV